MAKSIFPTTLILPSKMGVPGARHCFPTSQLWASQGSADFVFSSPGYYLQPRLHSRKPEVCVSFEEDEQGGAWLPATWKTGVGGGSQPESVIYGHSHLSPHIFPSPSKYLRQPCRSPACVYIPLHVHKCAHKHMPAYPHLPACMCMSKAADAGQESMDQSPQQEMG